MKVSERAVKEAGEGGEERAGGLVPLELGDKKRIPGGCDSRKSVSRDSVSVSVFGRGEERRNEGRLVWKSERGEVEGMPAAQRKRETESCLESGPQRVQQRQR